MRIQTLGLNGDDVPPVDESIGFWERQFVKTPTERQKAFDWAYGVVIPLICVAADPFVFANGGILAGGRTFAYVLSSVSIFAMVAWLLWGERLGWLAVPLGGLFIAGSGVSFIVGILIFPYSLLGLLILIGFLGFTPFFSAIVYLRNGVRALCSCETLEPRLIWQPALLAAIFAFVVPYVVHSHVSRMVNEIATGDVGTIRRESAKLSYVRPLVNAGPIANRYRGSEEKDSPRMRALADSYKDLTGKNIQSHSSFY